ILDEPFSGLDPVSMRLLKEHDVDPIRKWMSGSTDVRTDERIQKEIQSFLEEHDVKRVAGLDRIIGCPHEAGRDFPEGMNCPLCSFWTHRNRFTHELEE
ncbi:hypothetical protein JW906_02915, partial [bacterium]|nr:hypothetical protein [bacterium]